VVSRTEFGILSVGQLSAKTQTVKLTSGVSYDVVIPGTSSVSF